jgi:hypothetical protein
MIEIDFKKVCEVWTLLMWRVLVGSEQARIDKKRFLSVYLRGIVSKQTINGSKTAVMEIIGFLYASLGSSTIQFHDILGSRRACACSEAGFGSENGVRP